MPPSDLPIPGCRIAGSLGPQVDNTNGETGFGPSFVVYTRPEPNADADERAGLQKRRMISPPASMMNMIMKSSPFRSPLRTAAFTAFVWCMPCATKERQKAV
jgi:hypothetical protein